MSSQEQVETIYIKILKQNYERKLVERSLEYRIKMVEDKNREQEARFQAAIKWFFSVLTIVIATAIIGYVAAHWKG